MTAFPATTGRAPRARSLGIAFLVLGALFALAWSAAHLLGFGLGGPRADVAARPLLYRLAYSWHSVPGAVAVAAGAAQFAMLRGAAAAHPRARRRAHAWLGRAYAASALLLGASGFLIAPAAPGGFASHFGFRLLGALIAITTALAWVRIRQGDATAHAEWITRSFALVFAFAPFRFWLLVFPGGLTDPESYTAAGYWTLFSNLVVAEIVNARRRAAADPR